MLDQTSQAADTSSAAPEAVSQTTSEPAKIETPVVQKETVVVTPEQRAEADQKAAESDTKQRQIAALAKLREAKAARDGTPVKPTVGAADQKPAADAKPDPKAPVKDPVTGKFAPKIGHNGGPEIDKEKPAADAQPKKFEAPKSWAKEVKAHWEKIDPTLQEYLHNQERKVSHTFTQVGREKAQLERALETYKPLKEAVSKHTDTLKSWGLTADAAFDGLMETAKKLHTDPRATIAKLAEDYGVNLASYAVDLDPSQLPPDPRLETAATEINVLKRQVADAQRLLQAERAEVQAFWASLQNEEKQREENQLRQQYTKTRSDVDSWTKDLEFFDDLANDIATIYHPIVAKSGKFAGNPKAQLEHAYKLALANNETLQAAVRAKQAQEQAAKAAQSNGALGAARDAARLNAPSNAAGAAPAADDGRASQLAALKRARERNAQSRSAYAI
jgi:hypothetical protein